MNTRIKISRSAICLLLLSMALSPLMSSPAAAQGKVLRIKGREYSKFDPQLTASTAQATVENALFRGLLRYDDNGNLAPSIADSVPTIENGGISADGKTYTYKLREWKWSDGKGVVTAQDFVYSFQRLVDPKTGAPYGSFLNGIVANASEVQSGAQPPDALGVKAVDDKTVQVTLVKPVSYFNAIASMWIGFAVRKDNVERAGLPSPAAWTDPANGEVVGSGPFKITAWDHKKLITFERNPNFSGEAAKLDKIEFHIIDDEKVAYAAYQADELDISVAPSAKYESIKADPVLSKQLIQYKTACTNYLAMNNAAKPFDNKKVREAFTLGLDRDLRLKVIDQGINAKQVSWLPEGVPGYDPELGKQFEFNKAAAQKALADAGYPDGKNFPEVTFSYPSGTEGQRTADWYKEQYKQVLNIDIKLNPMDDAAYFNSFSDPSKRLPGLFEYGWCADYLHPSNWLYLVFGTSQGNNVFGYSNPEFDGIAKAADAELNPAKAMELYKQAHTTLVADFPVIFFNTPNSTRLVKPRVVNLKSNALDGGIIGGFFWEAIDVTS